MFRSGGARRISLILANILLPIAVLVFATGFFPYKPFLPGLATYEDVDELGDEYGTQPGAIFDRVVFMVVDALRSDFVFGSNSGFEFTQSLIRSGAAIAFTAHATPPTITMPRVKALTTGSVPSFLDVILNFAESDSTSSLASQDTWLAQLRAKGSRLVFYGDDTWLKLFPALPDGAFFLRSDGTSSFFVSDFTEVDGNVTRHVPDELKRDDWHAMIMHYLGLDHIGHKAGPNSPNMLPKQREMDDMVRQIFEAMETEAHHANTLLVLLGDHGMNAGGNHGGSGPGETEPALVFASPKLAERRDRKTYECPTTPKPGTDFRFYDTVEQSDLVPTLAALMGVPVSRNSLGIIVPDLLGFWTPAQAFHLLYQNARQVLGLVGATYGEQALRERIASCPKTLRDDDLDPGALNTSCKGLSPGLDELACKWCLVLARLPTGERASGLVQDFLMTAQDTMSSAASSYDVSRLVLGTVLATMALTLAIASVKSLWPPSSTGLYFCLLCALYATLMFASSYVEEEQHFWYWISRAWVVILTTQRLSNDSGATSRSRAHVSGAAVLWLALHRLSTRWNQTGQKHSGEPDIASAFFDHHTVFLWLVILYTYGSTRYHLTARTLTSMLTPGLALVTAFVLTVPAAVFKLNFTQADAPELVGGLALSIREWTAPFDLLLQARVVFVLLAIAAVAVIAWSFGTAAMRRRAFHDFGPTLTERLHNLLTLFLLTQTQARNLPLVLVFRVQQQCLSLLITPSDSILARKGASRSVRVAVSVLLGSYVSFFCMGGSNAISSIDLSNAYNGVAGYNVAAVGALLLSSNWAGPIWWCSAGMQMLLYRADTSAMGKHKGETDGGRKWVQAEREKLREDADAPIATSSGGREREPEAFMAYVSIMTIFTATSLVAVMAACTALRTHLFIWTVFSPKYLYAIAWSAGWHLGVNVALGALLFWLGTVT